MPRPSAAIPGVGDSHNVFAATYGRAGHTTALAGCILRQYSCSDVVLSALFHDGVCIAAHSNEPRLLARSVHEASVTTLQRASNGWLLAAACCPPRVIAALDEAVASAPPSIPVPLR
jgi:hypothetical protein